MYSLLHRRRFDLHKVPAMGTGKGYQLVKTGIRMGRTTMREADLSAGSRRREHPLLCADLYSCPSPAPVTHWNQTLVGSGLSCLSARTWANGPLQLTSWLSSCHPPHAAATLVCEKNRQLGFSVHNDPVHTGLWLSGPGKPSWCRSAATLGQSQSTRHGDIRGPQPGSGDIGVLWARAAWSKIIHRPPRP
jgi:hypothetical protein